METKPTTAGQAVSWYHSKIIEIPHDNMPRIPGKKYVSDEDLLTFFSSGVVIIQEKVDGHLYGSIVDSNIMGRKWRLFEDISCKNTLHDHVIEYKYPGARFVMLDYVIYDEIAYKFIFRQDDDTTLTYATLNLNYMPLRSVDDIHNLLRFFAKLPSHFYSPKIEGLVIKNYMRQEMLKWINPEFEDKIKGV